MKITSIISAARLRTLPLSISGIVLSFAYARINKIENVPIFILAILTAILFQILSNFANDYGDGIKGTDSNRKGEKRMVGSGEVSPIQMKRVVIGTALLALFSAVILLFLAFESVLVIITFLLLTVACIWAAIRYTVGDNAYGYSGFGDFFVFLFFGFVAVIGSYFLYQSTLDSSLVYAAAGIGFLSVSVLNLNNLRDVDSDRKSGKNTMVVKMGFDTGKRYQLILVVMALLCLLIFAKDITLIPFIAFLPLLPQVKRILTCTQPPDLDQELKISALTTFGFSVLFCILAYYN